MSCATLEHTAVSARISSGVCMCACACVYYVYLFLGGGGSLILCVSVLSEMYELVCVAGCVSE